jgi:hypothetical protein
LFFGDDGDEEDSSIKGLVVLKDRRTSEYVNLVVRKGIYHLVCSSSAVYVCEDGDKCNWEKLIMRGKRLEQSMMFEDSETFKYCPIIKIKELTKIDAMKLLLSSFTDTSFSSEMIISMAFQWERYDKYIMPLILKDYDVKNKSKLNYYGTSLVIRPLDRDIRLDFSCTDIALRNYSELLGLGFGRGTWQLHFTDLIDKMYAPITYNMRENTGFDILFTDIDNIEDTITFVKIVNPEPLNEKLDRALLMRNSY